MRVLTMKQYGLQMTRNLNDFLHDCERKKYATDNGSEMHAKMQKVIIDSFGDVGAQDIISVIKTRPDLMPFFTASAQTEVPIAGYLNGFFISRRIDRLLINKSNKTIDFIDYKTDSNKNEFIDKYRRQLKEYAELLHSAYPGFKINGYILWLHDWTLDKVI